MRKKERTGYMKKSRLLCLLLALLLIGSLLTACAPKQKTVHKLNFSIGDPQASSKAIYYQSLADKTLEATDGGLEITIHSGGTLFSHLEVLEGVMSGAADIGWFCTPFAPGQFPLAEVFQLPLAYGNQKAATYALQELYKQSPELQAELSEIKVLGLYTGPTNKLFTTVPVHTPADLAGLQIRTMSGAPEACLKQWGASPVFMGAGEIYEAMDKGVVQGFTFEWSGIKSNTLYEVFDYAIDIPFYTNPFIILMNKKSYDNIPKEYKEAFDEIWGSTAAANDYVDIFAAEDKASHDTGLNDYGIEEITLTDAELAQFKVYADQFIAEWSKSHSTDTFDAKAYYDLAIKLYNEGCEKFPVS